MCSARRSGHAPAADDLTLREPSWEWSSAIDVVSTPLTIGDGAQTVIPRLSSPRRAERCIFLNQYARPIPPRARASCSWRCLREQMGFVEIDGERACSSSPSQAAVHKVHADCRASSRSSSMTLRTIMASLAPRSLSGVCTSFRGCSALPRRFLTMRGVCAAADDSPPLAPASPPCQQTRRIP